MGKPRVLHVITGLNRGGAETVLGRVLPPLVERGQDHAVVSLAGEGILGSQMRRAGIPVHSLGMARWRGLVGALPRLRGVVRSFRPHVVQGWMYHGNLGASVAARLAPSSPGVAWNVRHSLDSLANEKPATRWVIRANRWLSKGPDRILYNSRVARLQHERFGFEPRRAELIPNGFQIVPEGRKGEIARSVRRQLGIPAGAVVVGHAARFHAMKDHALFLRSAASVAADRANLVFVLCGTGVSAENDELIRWIPADLRDRFWLLGERNDLSDLMAAMDILCLSSAWGEAFPNVLGEAMAMGTPCLATDVGDSQFLLAEAGRVVAPRDEAAFTAGLAELVNLGPEKRRSLGEEARARVASEFSMAGMVQRYGDLFQWLAEDPAGA